MPLEVQFSGCSPSHRHCNRPQRSCEGYVFTGVCLSTAGVSASVHAGNPPGSRHTPRSRHPLKADTPPGADPPREKRPLLRTVRILLEYILVYVIVQHNEEWFQQNQFGRVAFRSWVQTIWLESRLSEFVLTILKHCPGSQILLT